MPQIHPRDEAEGAKKIVIVTDDPDKYRGAALGARHHGAAPRRTRHRSARAARDAGLHLIIYDQTCATEKRRRRKRGKMVDPAKRVVINELVCEGCGDCGVQ